MSDTRLADYDNAEDAVNIARLLNEYALDPMGGGKPLSQDVISNLSKRLAQVPGAFSVLGFVNEEAVGLINCLPSFSTFKCRPVVNIHDITVSGGARRSGLCGRMLEHVQQIAVQRDCCKITLEVLEGNVAAKRAYEKFGFQSYVLDQQHGAALFWEKSLN